MGLLLWYLYVEGVIILSINTYLLDMDVMIPEHVVKNSDDSYSIFINARLSYERQIQAYRHALKHIYNGDYDKSDVDKIELEAHESESARKLFYCVKEAKC